MVAEQKYWFYDRAFYGSDVGAPKTVSSYALTFKGDTVITGSNYMKVVEYELDGKHDCQYPPCFQATIPYSVISTTIIGYIKEDKIAKKINFIPLQNYYCKIDEHEIFDFSLNIGDSLNFCVRKNLSQGNSQLNPMVDSVKNNLIYNKNRNTIYTVGIKTNYGLPAIGQVRIIEGIGYDKFGILFRDIFTGFCEGSLNNCNFSTATQNVIVEPKIQIFPNPASDNLFVQSEEIIKEIGVYDISGSLVIVQKQPNTVDVSTLPRGLYFMKIYFSNYKVPYYYKFSKQ